MTDLAFIGTGLMGAPMARRLMAAGNTVAVKRRRTPFTWMSPHALYCNNHNPE